MGTEGTAPSGKTDESEQENELPRASLVKQELQEKGGQEHK